MTISRLFIDNGAIDFRNLTSQGLKTHLLRLGGTNGVNSDTKPTKHLALAWGSRDPSGNPNGLLIAQAWNKDDQNEAKEIEILSLYVPRAHRRQGVARALINTMIRDCSKWEGSLIKLVYPEEMESTPYIESMTSEAQGWKLSTSRLCCTTLEARDPVHTFVNRCGKIGERQILKLGLTISPLQQDTLRNIQTIAEEKNLEPWAWPSNIQGEVLLERSRILKIKDHVIGWLLCTGQIGNHLFYRAGWVFDDWQSKGCLPAMIASVAKDAHFGEVHPMVEEGRMTPFPKAYFEFDIENEPMKHFSEKNLLPISSSIIYTGRRSINL